MSLWVRIMIIDQLMENCDHAEQLADRKKAEANVEEQKQLENDFINQFNLFMNNIELLYAMNNMIEIKLDDKVIKELEDMAEQGKRVYEEGFIGGESQVTVKIKKMNYEISMLGKKWRSNYKNSTLINNLVQMLQLIEPTQESKQRVKNLVKNLRTIDELTSNATITQVSNASDAYNEAEKLIQQMDLDENIKSFLKKVSEKIATLSDINPEVMEWLQKYNLKDKMKIIAV